MSKNPEDILPGALLCIAGHGCEVQLVLGPEDHVLGPDFQDGGRLQRSGDGEQRQLGGCLAPVILPLVLAV